MKYTLFLTQRCNLACDYCYVPQRPAVMSPGTASDALDFIFRSAKGLPHLEIGFFGGEPLLEFDLLREITRRIEAHAAYDAERVGLTVVTNGTIYSAEIAEFLADHGIRLCVSCDGPPAVQDAHRRSRNGHASSERVARTLRAAVATLPLVIVNAVYRPETVDRLPETIDYLSGLGLRQIYLNPDFSAPWTQADLDRLPAAYERVADLYAEYYRRREPHFVSLIDNKIAVLLRGGYDPREHCGMGRHELAFTPDRRIFPCERLVDDRGADGHAIGTLDDGVNLARMACRRAPGADTHAACVGCRVRPLCMHWCGCSNFFMSGHYNRVGPFLCASEKAAIRAAFRAFTALERELGPTFVHHLVGQPHFNSLTAPA